MVVRVLIVEDEQTDRVILGNIVEGMGHVVYFASNGEQAFKIYMSNNIDIVITDLVMPHVSGLEFIVALKMLCPDAPVIAVSSKGPEVLAEAESKGADVTFSKPVNARELLDAIARLAPADSFFPAPRSKVAARGNHRLVDEFEFEHKGRVRCIPAGGRLVDWMAHTTQPLWDIRLNGTSVGQLEANLDETKETVRKAATKLISDLPVQWIRERLANGVLADSELQSEALPPEVAEQSAEQTAEQTSPPTPTPPRHDRRGDEPLLKAADVGRMLGIPSKDVYQLPINRVRVGKRTVRWRPALVREFIEQRDESPLLDMASRSETEETRELDGEPPAH
jgi:CheY-like chemotaxis protein